MKEKSNLFIIIADHLLASDKSSKPWASDKGLRTSWYWLCGWFAAFFGQILIFRIPLQGIAAQSHEVTLIYRLLSTGLCLGLVVIAFHFTYVYAKFVLRQRGRLHLKSVLFFYSLTVVAFSKLFYFLYFIDPTLFNYPANPVDYSPVITDMSTGNYIMNLEFMLYSALSSLNTQYHGISANSAWVSVALFAQSLYSLCLVAVLIAGYVNQRFEYVDEDCSGNEKDYRDRDTHR